ncbi:MAG: LSM domain-containing protein [Candidatus Hodarchaeales archaeon]|jgi:small nuclear ribonucleoprotein (snRNP)-like protein
MNSPINFLSKSKGKIISIRLKNGTEISGRLTDSDMHMNISLEDGNEFKDKELKKRLGKMYIRGNTILFIALNPN